MEYCKKCGATIDKETGYCTNCGLHVQEFSEKKKNLPLKILLAVVAVIVVIFGVKTVFNGVSSVYDKAPNDGYLEVVDEMMDAVYVNRDIEKFVSLMPEAVVQAMIKANYGGDAQAFYEAMQGAYAQISEIAVDEGSVTWNINEEIDVTGVQLDHYEELYQINFGVTDKIRSAKALDITISYTSNGEAKEDNVYFIIGLINGEWYMIDFTEN